MSEDMIIPGQPAPQKRMTYDEIMAEASALQEDNRYLQEEIEYYKKAMAQDAAWSGSKSGHTAKERLADRLLSQRVPEGHKPVSEELYITRSSLFELFALIPSLARRDKTRILRDWMDIEALAQGGGNEQIVKTRQEELIMEVQLLRAVGDAPITGMTTVGAIITDRVESDQKINMPPQRKPQGWLGTLGLGGGNQ